MQENSEQLISETGAREFFVDAVQSALVNQHLTVCGETIIYLGNLLTSFINTARLYEQTPEGVMIRPLAEYYFEALEAGTLSERIHALRRMGDISLFISGLFAQSLNRSIVDIDYYIAMGGNAYGYLSDPGHRATAIGLRNVFAELSLKFVDLVDVLSEVGETTNLMTNNDVLRLYEIWLKSGSKRSAEKLKQVGINPVRVKSIRH